MPEIIFTGPAGRVEGRYHPARQKNAPIAIILHPHPQFGGTMNHQIIYQLYYAFVHRSFSVLRFNFRGVGRSQGSFDHGIGELSDSGGATFVSTPDAAEQGLAAGIARRDGSVEHLMQQTSGGTINLPKLSEELYRSARWLRVFTSKPVTLSREQVISLL